MLVDLWAFRYWLNTEKDLEPGSTPDASLCNFIREFECREEARRGSVEAVS